MSLQTFLPFSFGLKVNPNGTCSTPVEPQETVFPFVKNRRLWNDDFPEVAFCPQAIATIHDMYPNAILTREECNELLVQHGFPKMNQGNWTHACDEGLITKLSIKRFTKKHPKGVALYCSNLVGNTLNQLAHDQCMWLFDGEDPHGVGITNPMDKLQWISDFTNTLEQKGSMQFVNCDVGLPF